MTSVQPAPGQTISLIVVYPLAWLTITLLPYEVSSLAGAYGLGSSLAGWLAAAELLSLALTVAWLGRTVAARDKRRLALGGIAIGITASIGSILADDVALLVALRLLFGVGCGMIAAATNALPLLYRNPERVFAWMQLAVAINFGASIYGVGIAAGIGDREATFIVELALFVVLGGAGLLLPRGTGMADTAAAAPAKRLPAGAAATLTALALMYLSQAAVWAYAEQAGIAAGFTPEQLLDLLTIAAFTTPFGALAAAAMGQRFAYGPPLVIGFGVQIFVAVTVYCIVSVPSYAMGILVFNMTTPFTTAYLLSMLADLDGTGRSASLGGGAINFGGAAGPALGAMVAVMPGRWPIGVLSIAVLLLGLFLSLGSRRHIA